MILSWIIVSVHSLAHIWNSSQSSFGMICLLTLDICQNFLGPLEKYLTCQKTLFVICNTYQTYHQLNEDMQCIDQSIAVQLMEAGIQFF